MATRQQQDEFISTREAADLLGVALRTVQLWVEAGVLRAWKTAGGHRRIVKSSVDAMLQERATAIAGSPNAKRAASDSFRVLVVEDDPALLKLFEMYVSGWQLPLDLTMATNGFEGLVKIGEQRPDLLITDLNMPGMDGFRMIRSLRANPDYRDLDIMVVTALGKPEIAERGGLPADVKVFTKPVPFAELERILAARVEGLKKPRKAAKKRTR